VVFLECGQDVAGTGLGIDRGGRLLQPLLVAAQIGVTDLEQLIERRIHHFL
jgi:hypothetical protein